MDGWPHPADHSTRRACWACCCLTWQRVETPPLMRSILRYAAHFHFAFTHSSLPKSAAGVNSRGTPTRTTMRALLLLTPLLAALACTAEGELPASNSRRPRPTWQCITIAHPCRSSLRHACAPALLQTPHTPAYLPSTWPPAAGIVATDSYTCDPAACRPPACLCASNSPPGGLSPQQIPQFVLVSLPRGLRPLASASLFPLLHQSIFKSVEHCSRLTR